MEQKLLKIRATLYGRGSGLLFDQMDEDMLLHLRDRYNLTVANGEKKTRKKKTELLDIENSLPRSNLEKSLCRNSEGKLGIPAENIFACLIEAGRKVKNGRGFISTKRNSDLPGFLFLYHDFFPFISHSFVTIHKKMAFRNKKQLVWVWRNRVKEYIVDIHFALDTDLCHTTVAKELFRVAGTIGIGGHRIRPDKDGRHYGKFTLAEFQVLGGCDSNGKENFFEEHPELLKLIQMS